MWGLRQALIPLVLFGALLWGAGQGVSVHWSFDVPDVTPDRGASWLPGDGSDVMRAPGAALAVPVKGVSPSSLTDSYTDPRSGGRTHHAIDIFAKAGTQVVAAAPGTVIRVANEGLGGTAVYVRTSNGTYVHYYAHLFRIAPTVENGLQVNTGDVLGYVGTTGNARSYHLHFAVWKQHDSTPPYADEPVNPYPLLTSGKGV